MTPHSDTSPVRPPPPRRSTSRSSDPTYKTMSFLDPVPTPVRRSPSPTRPAPPPPVRTSSRSGRASSDGCAVTKEQRVILSRKLTAPVIPIGSAALSEGFTEEEPQERGRLFSHSRVNDQGEQQGECYMNTDEVKRDDEMQARREDMRVRRVSGILGRPASQVIPVETVETVEEGFQVLVWESEYNDPTDEFFKIPGTLPPFCAGIPPPEPLTPEPPPDNEPDLPSNVPDLPNNVPAPPSNVPAFLSNTPDLPSNIPALPSTVPTPPSNAPVLPNNVPAPPNNVPAPPSNVPALPSNVPAPPSNQSPIDSEDDDDAENNYEDMYEFGYEMGGKCPVQVDEGWVEGGGLFGDGGGLFGGIEEGGIDDIPVEQPLDKEDDEHYAKLEEEEEGHYEIPDECTTPVNDVGGGNHGDGGGNHGDGGGAVGGGGDSGVIPGSNRDNIDETDFKFLRHNSKDINTSTVHCLLCLVLHCLLCDV
eukprot:sb/3464329/